MVPVCVPEAQEQSPRRLDAQCVDEFLAQEAHGRRAEEDDPLLVEPDEALIGSEINELREVVGLDLNRVARRRRVSLHAGLQSILVRLATSIQYGDCIV